MTHHDKRERHYTSVCAYCMKARGIHDDHILPVKRLRDLYDFHDTVPACMKCNTNKLTRALVPVGYPRLQELRELTGKPFREWDGDVKSLAYSEVHK